MKTLLATFLAAWALFGVARAQSTNAAPAISHHFNYNYEFHGLDDRPGTLIQLGHGVNLGNMLEAPREGAWGVTVQEGYFPIIRQAGFTLIRVPIRWSAHVGLAPDYTIDPAFFSRVDWVVAQAEKNNLTAILDYHNDDALMKDPDANADRFVAIWKQIAGHYQGEPSPILFELLNEPNGKLDAPRWNDLLAKTLAAVRATNPTRTVVIGPVQWNSIGALSKLVLPDNDPNLLVTVHFYDPMTFTHQGASWIEGSDKWLGNTWGTDAEKLAVTQSFNKAAAWGSDHKRPMYLGEFGAFSKGDMDSRARWTAFVARTAESHGFPWTYWEFCSGFGVYDPLAHTWRQPLLEALMPKR
jgi:endoglucanase